MSRNTVLRTMNEMSLAAWFGGSLMGALALPRTARGQERPLQAEGAGWRAWQPVQTTAVATQLLSGAALTWVNRGRVVGQRGVAGASVVRTALTGAALAATAVAAREGRKSAEVEGNGHHGPDAAWDAPEAPSADGEDHHDAAPEALTITRMAQWAVPVLTGGVLVLDALMGEQQRPQQVAGGMLHRVLPDPLAERLAA
jgi:hypothetical protein